MNNQTPDNGTPKRVSFFSVMGSVFAAMFGVRSSKHRERDFTHGKAIHFIIGGIIATLLFILAIYAVVRLALRSAGV